MTVDIENQYKESNSLILDLETLTKRYNNLLIEYRQAVINYSNYLIGHSTDVSMVAIPASTYWGTRGISSNNSSTLQQCQALCASTRGCSGATFNPSTNGSPLCSLRAGESAISSGLPNDYAIISQGKHLLGIVESINQQLRDINQQIQVKTAEGDSFYDVQEKERKVNTTDLVNQFIQLSEERNKITEFVKDYENLEHQEKESNIMVTKNYYNYLLLVVKVILIIIILYGMNTYISYLDTSIFNDGGVSYFFIFGLILFILTILLFAPINFYSFDMKNWFYYIYNMVKMLFHR
jgi:hypothetical protein